MNRVGKGLIYFVLLVTAVFCFVRFRGEYNRTDSRSLRLNRELTNDVAGALEAAATRTVTSAESTNAVAETNSPPVVAGVTNEAPAAAVASNAPALASGRAGGGAPGSGRPNSVGFLAGFVMSLIGIAILLGWEFAQWAASRSTQVIGADLLPVEGDPEYEAAELEWTNGNHLDAIRLMREYLKQNPSQQHVAIRIAEIYEKDLTNYLAAALELEDVLNRRLPREKWGWTAVHLANLYSGRLNQPEKAVATLERIVAGYPETAAAKKARQRLGIPEPEEIQAGQVAAAAAAAEAPPTEEADSHLPQGFRSKKR